MAYTTQQLVDIYTNANLGKTPDLATAALIEGYAAGTTNANYTDPQALALTLNLLDKTTAVAVATRQFFVGAAPSAAGLAYIVNSTANANDLNDATGALAKFSQENRFINLSVSLATGSGEGAASFAAKYGPGISYQQTVAAAYDIIIGNNVAAAAGVNVADAVAYLSRADNITFLTNYVRGTGISTAAEIELAVKAALIGQILNVGVTYNLGAYANATTALLTDLSDGTLSTDTAAGVNILTAYPAAGATGTTYTLIPGADTIVGTGANDTFNALTVKADGAVSNTFTSFDSIDGGAGVDTLNIYTDGATNGTFPASATVKNVEIVNILNAGAAAALADASKYQGVQQLWQVNAAAAVTNLATGVTAGFRNVVQDVSVTTTATAVSASIALDNFADSVAGPAAAKITVDGNDNSALNTVTVSGTVIDGAADANTSVTAIALDVQIGKNQATATVNTSVATVLTIDDTASATTKVNTVNLAGSTGAVTFVGDADVKSITGGTGKDTLTLATTTAVDDAATAGVNETVSAVLDSGAGDDTITITTTGTGITTVNTGAGNDTVTHTTSGSGVLTVNLGEGNDSFKGAGVITANDVIDGGAGTDTLLLNIVGSANIGAFSNFEVFDAAGLAKTLDVEILATKNTVTEFVTTGDVGAGASLINLGTGVGYRIIGDTAIANGLSLTQKTAGALTVTLDIDESGSTAVTTAATARDALVTATNATSINAVFDSAFVGAATGAGDNATNLQIVGEAATSLTVVSGGTNAINDLDFTGASNGAGTAALLTSVTVSGSSALNLDLAISGGGAAQVSVNASALTGALTFNTADLKAESGANTFDGGVLTLGSGADVITITTGSSIAGIQKGTGEDAATQGAFDVLGLAGAVQAGDVAATATITVKDGLLTFNGAGPATLADAITLAATAADGVNEAVVFQYLGNSYVFAQGALATTADDVVVKLVGTTGLTGLDNVGAGGQLYVF
ncbi:hypothetical protein [Caulobacter sp.]|uniref:beta strand repeat-containing protein n=1 Tax=Caulobacter sp. TaxID=78 RepID=UPI0031CFA02B